MSARNRKRPYASHGKHRKRRAGVHKHRHSPETERWNDEHLIPRCPPWLDRDTYVQLADLRRSL